MKISLAAELKTNNRDGSEAWNGCDGEKTNDMIQVKHGTLDWSGRDGKWMSQFSCPLFLKHVSLNFITYKLIK